MRVHDDPIVEIAELIVVKAKKNAKKKKCLRHGKNQKRGTRGDAIYVTPIGWQLDSRGIQKRRHGPWLVRCNQAKLTPSPKSFLNPKLSFRIEYFIKLLVSQ